MILHVYLSDTTSGEIQYRDELREFLEETFSIDVEFHGDFFRERWAEWIPERLAHMRVRDPMRRVFRQPHPVEVEAERRRLHNPMGLVYDGVEFLKLCLSLAETKEDAYEVIVTNRLLATYADGRYHLRMVIMGPLSVISYSGIYEAPAKPAGCYIAGAYTGLPTDALAGGGPDRKKVMKMLLSQILFYRAFGIPFCEVPTCMLRNCHRWEEFEEVSGFCEKHARMLEELPWRRK